MNLIHASCPTTSQTQTQIAKHVESWQPPSSPSTSKEELLRPLALQLYSRRPLLYLRGHAQPLPASVLLRTARKPALSALSRGPGPSSLFKTPDNTLVVIKFDPRFGFAGECPSAPRACVQLAIRDRSEHE